MKECRNSVKMNFKKRKSKIFLFKIYSNFNVRMPHGLKKLNKIMKNSQNKAQNKLCLQVLQYVEKIAFDYYQKYDHGKLSCH